MLLMIMGILSRGATNKEPEASSASSMSYCYMRISAGRCISDGEKCGGRGDNSLCLRRLGLRRAISVLGGIAVGRTRGACGRVPRFQWRYFHPSFSC
jgi:hypothetical protein